jgi:hypothetical protein
MMMKKINDRMYEFFELGSDNYNREITDVVSSETEDDFSWLEESLNNADFEFLFEEMDDIDDVVITKPKTKRDEVLESLSYLKSKEFKTKQDRESIYTLEVVLKSMR